ncbi:MAG: stalk domain-containing protein [Bacillota bacterium]|nr:stalk domain-containing protein [Bacillota bacterium]
MKKYLLGLILALLLCMPVFAHPPITVYVDGIQLHFDQPPIIKDDRTLVPMRKIFEALEAEVIWDEPSQSVTAIRGDDVILLRIGRAELYKNGAVAYTMPVPAQIVNDRTLVPLRAVAESLGAEVTWDGVNYVIQIFGESKAPSDSGQTEPQAGGYSAVVRAPDGNAVLLVQIECEEVEDGKGKTAINDDMAEEVFRIGQDFMQEHQASALAQYGAAPNEFQPYLCAGSYALTREEEYASFFGTVTTYAGGGEEVSFDSRTYDLSVGKEIDLKHLVSDSQSELETLWEASFGAMIDAEPDAFYKDAKSRLQKAMDEVGFYLTREGIAFYLAPGILAPEESGVISFEIDYQF